MRTFLSLLGVTIGIFAIISMFTVIDSLQRNISDSFLELGTDIIYIQKFPWSNDPNYPWWKYRQRPDFKYEEYAYLAQNARTILAVVFTSYFSREVKYKSKIASNSYLFAITHDYDKIMPPKIAEGRYFSPTESQSGKNVTIIGATVAKELFGEESPIGKDIKAGGHTLRVIGVLEYEGDNMVSINDLDGDIMVPFQFAKSIVNIRNTWPDIMIKAKQGVSIDEMGDEARRLLRAYRRLKPIQEDNFALNEMSIITQVADQIFGTINAVGWIIGLFSIIVGGFGIANIMFVSVKERTHIIGIQKALGAKNYFILTQFLFESAFLAVMGGILGLLLIWGGTALISSQSSFAITLTLGNVLLGLSISAIVGIVSGIIPAVIASRLDPVVAINSK
jgi:putative ABC transport system permease protein